MALAVELGSRLQKPDAGGLDLGSLPKSHETQLVQSSLKSDHFFQILATYSPKFVNF